VENGQHLDTVGEHDEIDDVPKLLQPCGTHIFPDRAMQLWHLLDASQHFTNAGKNLLSKTDANSFKVIACFLDIEFCLWPKD